MEIWTIGHSNHAFEKFLGLLQQHEITLLVDVRAKPFSRFPQFTRSNLSDALRANKIEYLFGGKYLGGLSPTPITEPMFVVKMDAILKQVAGGQRVTLMCSEGKPLECHRAGKLTAWLHRHSPDIKTTHILTDGTLVDGREFEPHVNDNVIWRDFKASIVRLEKKRAKKCC